MGDKMTQTVFHGKRYASKHVRRLAFRGLRVALVAAAGMALQAYAGIIDLSGETVEISTVNGLNTYLGHDVRNGVLTVSANQGFADGTFTFGAGLVLNQTDGMWGTSGSRTVQIVDGCVVNYTSKSPVWFGRTYAGVTYNGTTQLILNNGTFRGGSAEISFPHALANNSNRDKNVIVNFLMSNKSSLSTSSEVRFGEIEQADGKKEKTLKVTVNVEDSAITAKQLRFGQTNNYLSDPANSYVSATFGPESELTVNQLYAYAYPAPTVTFNGATIHYAGTGSNSFIGQNSGLSGDLYEILSEGLTVDIPSGKTLTVDGNSSAIKGVGGITKIGAGSIFWNNITSKGSQKMLFTGPLVVTEGAWSSSLGYAATAFRAEGGNLTLSGALSSGNIAFSAADGVLTLAGATITDAAPALTLASGGSTDYFTRDGAVATYTLDSFDLGEGAILDLDANATDIDTISVATTNLTATAANPVTINLFFSDVPASGRTFRLFKTDDKEKFTVVPVRGGIMIPHEVSVADGYLTLTITAVVENYTWNTTKTNWGDTDAWTKEGEDVTWVDGNNAIFATADAAAVIAAPVLASKVEFTAPGVVTGTSPLTVADVSVASGVSATISAPTAGQLTKIGVGTLSLGMGRTEETTLSEGTLAFASGATVNAANLLLGTDAAKPVAFDYGGQTLTANPISYIGTGTDVTLLNGVFTYGSDIAYSSVAASALPPAVLTVASGATLSTSSRFIVNTPNEFTLNIAGGKMVSAANNNNWLMQATLDGRLNINVTDGGELEFGGYTRMLTCRDVVDGSTAYQSPSLYMTVVDSTVRVKNSGICFGYDYESNTWQNKNPVSPVFVLAMTNALLDVGTAGVYLGNGARGAHTDGSYTADLEGCVVTAKEFRVWYDRPLNAARFNNTRLVLSANSDYWLDQQDLNANTIITAGPDGIVLDSNGFSGTITANIGGEGALTKTGTGTLRFATNQTATAALRVKKGTVRLNGGFSLERPTTVEAGAGFSVQATRQTHVASLAFEAGSTFNVDEFTVNVVPMSVTALTFPEQGVVGLTMDGKPFRKGAYKILSKRGITVADGAKFAPSTGGEAFTWSVDDDTLILSVGLLKGKTWTGLAGDGRMSNGGNWYGGEAPVAGDELYFIGVNTATEIIADIPDSPKFGDVLMGAGVITFSGMLAATSFSDTSKIAVAEGATVSLDGDVVLDTTNGAAWVVDKVDGEFIVGGRIYAIGKNDVWPTLNSSTGIIVAGGIANDNANWVFRLATNKQYMRWAFGRSGITGTHGVWMFADAAVKVEMQPYDCDFEINDWVGVRSSAQGLFLSTTGYKDGLGHVVTANKGFLREGYLHVSGLGALVCNYAREGADIYGQTAYEVNFTVHAPATLALVPGSDIGTGTVKVEAGATLRVEGAGTATLSAALTCEEDAKLSFRLTDAGAIPKLALDKAPSFISVKLGFTLGDTLPLSGVYTIMEWPGDAEVDPEAFSFAEPKPEWVQRLAVEGNKLNLVVVPVGTFLILR
ncbi:MAG: hypothetical protein J6336_09570 [Kiritimatiellae bacterium]|nr:hypothetical protein [Kiritimatiellia bacterium]